MAAILLRTTYTNPVPYGDRTNQFYGTAYDVTNWVFDTATRSASQQSGGVVNDDFDSGQYQDFSYAGEFFFDCAGTTRRSYVHDGAGDFSIEEEPNSGACQLLIITSQGHTDETAARNDGSITATPSGGSPPLTAVLVETGRTIPATQPDLPVTVELLPPGRYRLRFTDAAGRVVEADQTIRAYAASGCTDPNALNPTPGATADDGSCQYTPVVLTPFFAVPLLQSLRFAVRDGQPESFENTLFCEQTRPGQQVRPYYYQLVSFDDTVRVQVLSSYAAVRATISRHGGSQVAAVDLQQVLKLDEEATPLAVVLRLDAASGTTQLRAAAGGGLPAGLLAAARLTLAGLGTYRITRTVPGSAVSLDDYLVLNRPWQDPPGGNFLATWPQAGPGYNVWEADLPLAGLAAGDYEVRLRASSPGWPTMLAESEPLKLAATHKNSVVLDYRNADNCFGMVFSTGITPRLRVPGTFFRQGNGGTESTYRATAGNLTVLSSTATRLRQLETYALPAYLHEKIFLACRLDFLAVNGVRCQTDQAYEVSDQRTYPLAGGRVMLEQAQWLGAGNGDDFGVDETAPENALALRRGGYLLLRGE